MKYQPKVSKVETYSDNQGEHVVHEGKLVFISKKDRYATLQSDPPLNKYVPIIISETEKIEIGDWVYNRVSKHSSTNSHIYKIERNKQLHNANQSKILALLEHL